MTVTYSDRIAQALENERPTFRPGRRVTAVIYGQRKTGSVEDVGRSIIWVIWDSERRMSWHHPESLTLLHPAQDPDLMDSKWGVYR